MLTTVPPAVEPVFGEIEVTLGATYVNAPDAVTVFPPVVTTTSTAPAACGGVVPTIAELLTARTVAAAPPNVTVVVPLELKFEPLIVKSVPPDVEPVLGETPVMLGCVTAFTVIRPNMLECPVPQDGCVQTHAKVPGVVAVNVIVWVSPRPTSTPPSMYVSMRIPWPMP
jgi:hypothetical protein